jgi:single-strand DNA-binding protein
MGINKTIIIANLTKDVELKYTSTGKAIANFSIAYNDGFGDKKEVSYFDVQVWEKQAENCENYLKKGSLVAIEGKLVQQRWQDKASGQTRSKVVINANQVQFLDSKGKANEVQNDPWQESEQPDNGYPKDDDWIGR